MPSLITSLKEDIAARLEADPAFADVTVIVADRGDVETQINEAVSKVGQWVLVYVKQIGTSEPDVSGPFFDRIKCQVEIGENRALRPDGASEVDYLAEVAFGLLHHWVPDSLVTSLYAEPTAITYGYEEGLSLATISLNAAGAINITIPTVADVGRSSAAGNTTLTCATAGAAIYYTTNGKHASPRNGTLYTSPFADPAAATTLKARAWLAGYHPSEPLTHTY